MSVLRYPASRAPTQILDLSPKRSAKNVRLLQRACIFFNIMNEWKVKNSDARVLLRDMGNSLFYDLKLNSEGKVLDSDRLYRISHLVGIYRALYILYGEDLSNRFVHLPNTNRMFNGSTPLEFMKKEVCWRCSVSGVSLMRGVQASNACCELVMAPRCCRYQHKCPEPLDDDYGALRLPAALIQADETLLSEMRLLEGGSHQSG